MLLNYPGIHSIHIITAPVLFTRHISVNLSRLFARRDTNKKTDKILDFLSLTSMWFWLTSVLYSICCRMSLSSLREYRASPVIESMGPFSICCLMAQNSMKSGSPAHSFVLEGNPRIRVKGGRKKNKTLERRRRGKRTAFISADSETQQT